MMGIGVDIISMARMAETLDRSGDVFLKRVFSSTEIALGRQSANPTAFFAMSFAAKEAAFKALALRWEPGLDLRDMEVTRGPAGEPLLELSGQVARLAGEKGCARVLISLSYETEQAIGVALVIWG
jgi:holo-[acyl-carrier protein] synthase